MAINESHILADSDVLGNFNFITYNIFLLADDASFIKNIRDDTDILTFNESVELFSVMTHEYRHYYDMTHTTYGINYLFDLAIALGQGIDVKSGDEFKYYTIKEFTNNLKKIRYPKFYNVLLKQDNSKKWELRPTIGKVYDSSGKISDRPILFARYYDVNNQLLCRHPFSMVSLLECSATLDEHLNSIVLITHKLKDKPANKDFLIKKFEKKSIDYIYDINLTEYSTCFHLVANHFGITELQEIFSVTRILLDICLNFTDSHFEIIHSKNVVDRIFNPPEGFDDQQLRQYIEFHTALKFGIQYKERPILFYVLLKLMSRDTYTNKDLILEEINNIFDSLGLSVVKIFEDANRLIVDKAEILKNSEIKYFSLIAESVKKNAATLIKEPSDVIDKYSSHINKYLDILDLPNIQIGDSFFRLGKPQKSVFDDIDYEECFEEIGKLEKWVQEFDDACFY